MGDSVDGISALGFLAGEEVREVTVDATGVQIGQILKLRDELGVLLFGESHLDLMGDGALDAAVGTLEIRELRSLTIFGTHVHLAGCELMGAFFH